MRPLPVTAVLLALAAAAAFAPAADEPKYNGRTRSEWEVVLKENQSARLRKVAVVSLGGIAAENPQDAKMVTEVMTAVGKALLTDSAPGVRAEAAKVLGQAAAQLIDEKAADPASVVLDLSKALAGEREADAKVELAVALARYGRYARTGVSALAACLADKDPKVLEAAATALGRVGADAKGAADALLPLLKHADKPVRLAAASALGRVEPDDIGRPSNELVAMLKAEKETDVRREVVTALGLLGDKSPVVVTAVATALADADVDVRRQAGLSLVRFGGGAKAAEAVLFKAFTEDADKLVRLHALQALCVAFAAEDAKAVEERLLPKLIARLKADGEPDVRVAICDEFGALGPTAQPAVPVLREAQKDAQIKVRDAAAGALKKVIAKPKPPETKPPEKAPDPKEPGK